MQGSEAEKLQDYQDIPVTRKDMRTLRHGAWLNDEVINLWFKLCDAREKAGLAAASAGATDDVTAQWPRCHFMQSNFYTKLAESAPEGFKYANVKRWTKKVRRPWPDRTPRPLGLDGERFGPS